MYEYITLRGKRNSTGMIKLKILRGEDFFHYLGGPSVITRVLIRKEGNKRVRIKEIDIMAEAEVRRNRRILKFFILYWCIVD